MTQLESARMGIITESMKQAAEYENQSPESMRERVAAGVVVIPSNRGRNFRAMGIGQGLSTKINANIGTSPSRANLDEELEKMRVAVDAGAHAIMDLSTGGDLENIMKKIVSECPVMVGTVPIYKVMSRLMSAGKSCPDMTADDLFNEIENQARLGVDFVTVHCGITRENLEILDECGRVMGIVSRGGSLMAEWVTVNRTENPLFQYYDRLVELCREYDVTLSLGDGLRPGAICDAEDRAQVAELITLGRLCARARKAGVQVMIEGPGHVPLHRIASDMKIQKRLCDNAPYYVLGPLPTDIAPGYDHITAAIGGAIAASSGADFLCYVTPAEHLTLPDVNDVREGVIASKIAAHIGDIEKGLPGAWDRNLDMSVARRNFDWKAMFNLSLDPAKAKSRREGSADRDKDVCSMCGEMCAIKSYDRAVKADCALKKGKNAG